MVLAHETTIAVEPGRLKFGQITNKDRDRVTSPGVAGEGGPVRRKNSMEITEQERQLLECLREEKLPGDTLLLLIESGSDAWHVSLSAKQGNKHLAGKGSGDSFAKACDDIAPLLPAGPKQDETQSR
jgi:hypothetical protein